MSNSTGAAGFIQSISMFAQGHIVAGVFGIIATAGWTIQGLGNLWYYRQVRFLDFDRRRPQVSVIEQNRFRVSSRSGTTITPLGIRSTRYAAQVIFFDYC